MAMADIQIISDTKDYRTCLRHARRLGLDGVTTIAASHALETIGVINSQLGLSGHSMETVALCSSKDALRDRLSSSPIHAIGYRKCTDIVEAREFIRENGFPVITKPTDSSGSRGIIRSDHPGQLDDNFQYSMSWSNSKTVIIEEFIQGSEYSVETLSYQGDTTILAITEKETTGFPYYTERSHRIPARLPDDITASIMDFSKDLVEHLEIENGPLHIEIILSERGPKVVEINARPGGDYIWSHLIHLSTGYDALRLIIENALGQETQIVERLRPRVASVSFFCTREEFLIEEIQIDDRIYSENLIELEFKKEAGQRVAVTRQSRDRFGHFIVVADDYQICDEQIVLIRNGVVFHRTP